MKVAIDLRPLQIGHQNRGIGACLLNLLERLPSRPDTKFIFMRYDTTEPLKDYQLNIPGEFKEIVIKKRAFSRSPYKMFLYAFYALLPSYWGLRKYKPDVFFQSDYTLGAPKLRGCRVVTIAYDLIPLKFKQIYLPDGLKYIRFGQYRLRSRARRILRAWFYKAKYKKAVSLLKRSDQVISISNNTKKDLVEVLGINEDSIKVIYLAASFRENPLESKVRPEIKDLIDGIDTPVISYVGATDMRRQVDQLIFAFNLYNARESSLSLVLCGGEFEIKSKEINFKVERAYEESSYKSQIYRLGKVTEAEKKYILSKSAAFVYPTLYEGFGLPLLEAMLCGTRIVSYFNSSIPEIAGDFPIYTQGYGSYPIFLALKSLLDDKEANDSLSEQMIKKASEFSWDKTAEQVWSLVLNSSGIN